VRVTGVDFYSVALFALVADSFLAALDGWWKVSVVALSRPSVLFGVEVSDAVSVGLLLDPVIFSSSFVG